MNAIQRIILIDDNEMDNVYHQIIVQRAGFSGELLIFESGAEALDYLFGTGAYEGRDVTVLPAIVLLDLKLPKVDGMEVLRRLRADPRTRLVPVIVLTASKEEEDVIGSYSLGANAYVRKPVSFTEFAEAAKVLGK